MCFFLDPPWTHRDRPRQTKAGLQGEIKITNDQNMAGCGDGEVTVTIKV